MITPFSNIPANSFGDFVFGKYAIFKSKDQVSLFWAEPARIVTVTPKAVECVHAADSTVYGVGSGKYATQKPIRHRKTSLIAVCDTIDEVNRLAQINVDFIKNVLTAQATSQLMPENVVGLETFVKAQDRMLYTLIENA